MRSLNDFQGDLARPIFEAVAANYARGGASTNKDRSRQNWRWCILQPQISPHNRSPEVVLERAIASSCLAAGRLDWANQVPVASGLLTGASEGRRAIDLVHQRGDGHFEFIELKIASDTPLYAAIEIVAYACIWLLARNDRPSRPSPLLDADHISLRVLAPSAYYAPFALQAVEAALHRAVSALGTDHGVTFTFGFDVLDERLTSLPPPQGDTLLSLLAARKPLLSTGDR